MFAVHLNLIRHYLPEIALDTNDGSIIFFFFVEILFTGRKKLNKYKYIYIVVKVERLGQLQVSPNTKLSGSYNFVRDMNVEINV